MGKLAGADRETTVSVRVDPAVVEEFDARCEERGVSRSEALRQHMRDVVEQGTDADRMQPPTDDDLARAYSALVELAGVDGGHLRDDRAKGAIAQALGVSKAVAWGYVRRLQARGYVRLSTDSTLRFTSVEVQT